MSFEDIELARVARTAKDVIRGKGKRGRKRKSAALEPDEPEPEPEPEVAYAAKEGIKSKGKRSWKRRTTAREAEEPEPDNRCASALEGTSCADDMRLLYKRAENRFPFPLVRIWFLEVGNRI